MFNLVIYLSTIMRAILLIVALVAISSCYDKILLKDIKSIVLRQGQCTTARRTHAVPQLSCVGGTASYSQSSKVDNVMCTNKGFDGRDAVWECKAQLPDTVKLGRFEVNCEGYSYPNDPYVLVGSCGLEYELDYTEKYYQQQRQTQQFQQSQQQSQQQTQQTRTTRTYSEYYPTSSVYRTKYYTNDVEVFMTFLFAFFFVSLVVYVSCAIRRRYFYVRDVRQPIYTSPTVAVVETQPSSSGFVDGIIVGSVLSHRNTHTVPVHTHTETVVTNTVIPPAPPLPPAPSEHVSTSFGSTKRR